MSRDFEDIALLVDGRAELTEETGACRSKL